MQKSCKTAILIVNNDITSSLIFTPLLNCDALEIKLVIFDGKLIAAKKSVMAGAFQLLNKMSKKYWIYQSFMALCYRLASVMPHSFIRKTSAPTLKQICRAKGIEFITSNDVNGIELINKIQNTAPDYAFIRCSQIIKAPLLSSVKDGFFCVHSSILPSYRGIAAEFHAMCKAEQYVGSSIFQVAEKLDEGAIFIQRKIAIQKHNTHYALVKRNNMLAAQMLIDFVKSNCQMDCQTDDAIPTSYYSWPKSQDMEKFSGNSLKLMSIKEIFEVFLSIFMGINIKKILAAEKCNQGIKS